MLRGKTLTLKLSSIDPQKLNILDRFNPGEIPKAEQTKFILKRTNQAYITIFQTLENILYF